MKIGIIGNTVLTYKVVKLLLQKGYKIEYVFGLPDDKLKNKVNAYDLKTFCLNENIQYINSNEWKSILNKKVDIVYEMGDSRIIPSFFLQKNIVIGNHGAILPCVQGAASLVWGRMLNSGRWGVSLMKLNEQIDGGDILITKEVVYDKNKTTMKEFVEMCDNATVECVKQYIEGSCNKNVNKPWGIKVAKNLDSKEVVDILRICLEKGINVYLPPRKSSDAEIKPSWELSFIENFKKANDLPYPKYYENY